VQPIARGLDRLFRLLREDNVASVRAALKAHGNAEAEIKPVSLENASIVDIDLQTMCFHMEFDVHQKLAKKSKAEKVCHQPLHLPFV
jgi:hypothetical protein